MLVISIKRALSKWLTPEIHNKAERYDYLHSTLSDAQRWLGYEWPEVNVTIHWAKAAEVNHFRSLHAPCVETVVGKPWIYTITDFREHLRSEKATHA